MHPFAQATHFMSLYMERYTKFVKRGPSPNILIKVETYWFFFFYNLREKVHVDMMINVSGRIQTFLDSLFPHSFLPFRNLLTSSETPRTVSSTRPPALLRYNCRMTLRCTTRRLDRLTSCKTMTTIERALANTSTTSRDSHLLFVVRTFKIYSLSHSQV